VNDYDHLLSLEPFSQQIRKPICRPGSTIPLSSRCHGHGHPLNRVNRHYNVDRDHGDGHRCDDDHRVRGGDVWTMNVGLSEGMRRPTIHQKQNSIALSKTTYVRPCYRLV